MSPSTTISLPAITVFRFQFDFTPHWQEEKIGPTRPRTRSPQMPPQSHRLRQKDRQDFPSHESDPKHRTDDPHTGCIPPQRPPRPFADVVYSSSSTLTSTSRISRILGGSRPIHHKLNPFGHKGISNIFHLSFQGQEPLFTAHVG